MLGMKNGHCMVCANGACDAKKCVCHWMCKGTKAKLILRLALGIIFVLHGYGKLFGGHPGMEAFTGMVAGMGFPAPTVFAYAAALSEFVGGICVIVGLGTRYAASAIAIVMLVAWGKVKHFALPMGDIDFLSLAVALSLVLTGPGKASLDKKYCNKENATTTGCANCKDGKCMCSTK